jgi:hypothetical protein
LPRLLTEAGLRDVTHEGIARIVSGGSAWSTHLQETWRLIDSGFVEECPCRSKLRLPRLDA